MSVCALRNHQHKFNVHVLVNKTSRGSAHFLLPLIASIKLCCNDCNDTQVGSILGPSIAANYATVIGVARLYSLGALAMALMVGMVAGYVRHFGVPEALAGPTAREDKGKGAGVLEGFHLFLKYAYVRGIFALSCLFMVEGTILDYTMKVSAICAVLYCSAGC